MPISDSDHELVRRIRANDQQAWQQLIDRYNGRLLAFVQRRIAQWHICEEIVQDTFIGFYNSLPNYDEKRGLQTYLFTIASHKVIDHLRKVGNQLDRQIVGDAKEELLDQQLDDHQRKASSIARDHEKQQLEEDALIRGLRNLLQSMREKGEYARIQVLELLFVRGWANRDVARFLDINEQQVANYRFAAVRKLAEQMRNANLSPEVFPELADTGD